MNRREVKSFILYCNFEKQFKLLSMEERGQLISAIFAYVGGGEETGELSGMAQMAFSFIKDTLDRDHAEYLEKCEVNTQNGKKGGRPKKAVAESESFSAPKTERFFEKPKKPYNDNDNDNDNGNENENAIDIGNGKEKDNDNDTFSTCAESEPSASSVPSVPCRARDNEEEKKKESRHIIGPSEFKRLLGKGVPEHYINERRERAENYAREVNLSAYTLILEWWRFDKDRALRRGGEGGRKEKCGIDICEKSYDTDEFFEEALRRAKEEFSRYSEHQNDSFCEENANIVST